MREIKFRVWHTRSDLLRSDTPQMEYFTLQDIYWRGEDTGDYDFPRKDDIVMQYTGLKDKNGKEIYEGDILEFVTYDRELLEVYWYEETLGWQMKRIVGSGTMFIPNYTDYLEVIGNIWENGELLK